MPEDDVRLEVSNDIAPIFPSSDWDTYERERGKIRGSNKVSSISAVR